MISFTVEYPDPAATLRDHLAERRAAALLERLADYEAAWARIERLTPPGRKLEPMDHAVLAMVLADIHVPE